MKAIRNRATKRLVRWLENENEPPELEPEEEAVSVTPASASEAHNAALADVGDDPEELSDIVIEDDGVIRGIPRGDESLDRLREWALIALLRYGRVANKSPDDPITYGDLLTVASHLRRREIDLNDPDKG
ncbi:MAG: hypothetical protein ACFB50_10850 [Rubrobacteraceae bacterium]